MTSVETTESDTTVTISLNRPDKRNALNMSLIHEFSTVLAELCEDPTKGILLRGNGPVTCAGADLAVIRDGTPEEKRELIEGVETIYHRLLTYPRPTVMACKGAGVGGGFQLAMASDFAIIGEETTLYKPEIGFGVYSEYATKMIEAKLGTQPAREITLAGDPVSPERALAFGIAKEVVPEPDVDRTARELVDQLADYDERAYELAKTALGTDLNLSECGRYP